MVSGRGGICTIWANSPNGVLHLGSHLLCWGMATHICSNTLHGGKPSFKDWHGEQRSCGALLPTTAYKKPKIGQVQKEFWTTAAAFD